jgi:hypothetical protein
VYTSYTRAIQPPAPSRSLQRREGARYVGWEALSNFVIYFSKSGNEWVSRGLWYTGTPMPFYSLCGARGDELRTVNCKREKCAPPPTTRKKLLHDPPIKDREGICLPSAPSEGGSRPCLGRRAQEHFVLFLFFPHFWVLLDLEGRAYSRVRDSGEIRVSFLPSFPTRSL